ncbi:uncharacterized protein LOC106087701 [Stomoxys calcitrans]|uniref:uncharacterized protein LOC106087701 n=1 Tax=Stomoxys calcitrans TaxID=35570 RepID=UPI0027E2E47C|nr:uncharacterized protein LOC106087701 [Stomoxys calcitrans]
MNKFLIALFVIAAIQSSLTLPLDNENAVQSLKDTQRYKLIEDAYGNFQKSLWPVEVFPSMLNYIKDLKKWSENDAALKNSPQHVSLRQSIGKCLELLEKLATDADNCELQISLRTEHERLKKLFKSQENHKLQEGWLMKYADMMLVMRPILKKSSEKFHLWLATTVQTFINSLDANGKQENDDILHWYEKFAKEDDDIRQHILAIEFMGLFPDERPILEAKCKIQFANNF